jgi:cold shock CspA family protein
MIPTLGRVILNGASRHRLSKGFIIVSDSFSPIDASVRDRIIQTANQALTASGFVVESRLSHDSLIGLTTPFLPVYDVLQRDNFIKQLAKATSTLMQAARYSGNYRLIAAGVNPFVADSNNQVPALCADLHQIEVFDDGEIERIYNLFRQFLPELLAISTHSAVYGGTIQKDFSWRMRVNPASFLPRYLSQFSTENLDKLRNMMRKDYGLTDLQQMDVNPLAGDSKKLTENNVSLLSSNPAAAELRFVDSQSAYPFIRTQIILFQAIAMYGRSLARAGKRLPYMRDEVIDENKALAVQDGPGAILKPDEKFKKDKGRPGLSFHDEGNPERATTALLITLDRLLLPYLRELGCQYSELAPIILGAELRQAKRKCYANYAEYQKSLYYKYSSQFAAVFQQQTEQLLNSSELDYVTDFNQHQYPELAKEIEQKWNDKLQGRSRQKPAVKKVNKVNKANLQTRPHGEVKYFYPEMYYGLIALPDGSEIFFHQNDLIGISELQEKQRVCFDIEQTDRGAKAVRIRLIDKQSN